MKIITLESKEVLGLIPVDAICGDVGIVLEGVYYAKNADSMLAYPISLKQYEENYVVLDGTKRSLISIISGSSLIGNVYETRKDCLANSNYTTLNNFDAAEELVAKRRKEGIDKMIDILLLDETKREIEKWRQEVKGWKEENRWAYSLIPWAIDSGLKAYDDFLGSYRT